MPATWPATLPQRFETEGYSESFGEGRRFSRTDTGPGKVLRRTSAAARPLAATALMTKAQLSTFETFFRDTLSEGSLPFELPAPRDPETTILVRFATNALPSWTAASDNLYRVTLPMEILP